MNKMLENENNKIFDIINKNINDAILYENDVNLEKSISALQECDERDFIKARLAFIKLYPVPLDFVSFKDLITYLHTSLPMVLYHHMVDSHISFFYSTNQVPVRPNLV